MLKIEKFKSDFMVMCNGCKNKAENKTYWNNKCTFLCNECKDKKLNQISRIFK